MLNVSKKSYYFKYTKRKIKLKNYFLKKDELKRK